MPVDTSQYNCRSPTGYGTTRRDWAWRRRCTRGQTICLSANSAMEGTSDGDGAGDGVETGPGAGTGTAGARSGTGAVAEGGAGAGATGQRRGGEGETWGETGTTRGVETQGRDRASAGAFCEPGTWRRSEVNSATKAR